MVEFHTDTGSNAGHTKAFDVLAVSFSSAPPGAPSALTSRTPAPSAPETPRYTPVAPCKDVFTKSPQPCHIYLSMARPCDCVKYIAEDIRKAVKACREQKHQMRREEGYH